MRRRLKSGSVQTLGVTYYSSVTADKRICDNAQGKRLPDKVSSGSRGIA